MARPMHRVHPHQHPRSRRQPPEVGLVFQQGHQRRRGASRTAEQRRLRPPSFELLDLDDGQRVLDACAAPGGKTAHLLERADLALTALEQCHNERVRLNPGARELVATMKAHGARAVLVSGGFRYFTSRVSKMAGFDADRANTLIDDGKALTGAVGIPILGREAKLTALIEETSALGLTADDAVALGDGAKGGNQIAVLQFPLGQAAASVSERLSAIRAETGRLKDALGKRGSDTVMLYTTLVHALPLLVERVAENAAPKLSNLLISNPFGFAGEPYLMGAKVELALPVSVVAAGHKLNVTAVTLGPRLQIGFLAMPEAVPHIEQLARLTEQAFDGAWDFLDQIQELVETWSYTPGRIHLAEMRADMHRARGESEHARSQLRLALQWARHIGDSSSAQRIREQLAQY